MLYTHREKIVNHSVCPSHLHLGPVAVEEVVLRVEGKPFQVSTRQQVEDTIALLSVPLQY
ncbi:hypothetical protein OUZ56_013708 [Daphnia magna]|uniref:Uncharacterized protein n=1 Tax=Daphnia magna TaxID=35525 RepID=A0ABQ9Z6P6_9CRUS|nr:hypothetical protein OUZ56_013708 [Daphnia magna]